MKTYFRKRIMNVATQFQINKVYQVTLLLFSFQKHGSSELGTRHNTQCTSCMGTTRMTMEIESQEELRSFLRATVYILYIRTVSS